jgi:hypothetical protein
LEALPAGDTPAASADAPGATADVSAAPVETPATLDTAAPVDASLTPATASDAPAAADGPAAPGAAPAPGAALRSERIQLVGEGGRAVTLGVRTPLGKHVVRQFGDDSNVWDTEQCIVERGADGAWQIVPAEGTTNETLVNGHPIMSATPLHEGDVVAVGRAAKGIVKLPLTVRTA